ncbi:MAG: hypothetical protein GC162_07900 [Planctomycetes bacterium]|nr:hypothetical protein [Planctomycetota bacterium]
MPRYLFKIEEVVTRRGRPTVLITNRCVKDLPMKLHVGDAIELRPPHGEPITSRIGGIELTSPYNAADPYAFFLPRNVDVSDIQTGCEVFLLGTDTSDAS